MKAFNLGAALGVAVREFPTDTASDIRVDWSVVTPDRIRAVNHEQLAGLQLADAVASGGFFSVHRNPYGEVEDRYLKLMSRTIYRREQRADGYGLKFWCGDDAEVQRILRAAEEGFAARRIYEARP